MVEIIKDPTPVEEREKQPEAPAYLRCTFCAEPLVKRDTDGAYIHDYPTIGLKLVRMKGGNPQEGAKRLAVRCKYLHRNEKLDDLLPKTVAPEGKVWNPDTHRWINQRGLEPVNGYGGTAGTLDGETLEDINSVHVMNLINTFALIYYAEEMDKTGKSWDEVRWDR